MIEILCLLLSAAVTQADDWDLDGATPATETKLEESQIDSALLPSGKIFKWCDDKGKVVRYSSQFLAELRLCGEVEAVKSCDPSGRRFIAPSSDRKAPYAFRDCELGPRIIVERIPEGGVVTPADEAAPEVVNGYANFAGPTLDRAPLSEEERLAAQRDLKELENARAGDLATELQQMFKELSGAIQHLQNPAP